MGSCASKSQFKSDDLHDYGREKAADAAVTVYSPHPGSDLQKSTEKPVGVSKDKPSLPYQPETPKNYSIPARRGPPSVSGSTDQRPCPLPISKVRFTGTWPEASGRCILLHQRAAILSCMRGCREAVIRIS